MPGGDADGVCERDGAEGVRVRLHITVTGRTGPQTRAQGGVPGKLYWSNVEPSQLAEVFAEIARNIHDAPLFQCSGSVEILVQAHAAGQERP